MEKQKTDFFRKKSPLIFELESLKDQLWRLHKKRGVEAGDLLMTNRVERVGIIFGAF